MSTNKPEVTTTKFDRVRHKLDRYCVQRDKLLAQVTVSQNELMIICQKRNGYSSLGPVFRQRLHVFLQGEREQAEIWRDAVTRQFPGWFDLPHNKEDVRDGLKEDWEAFRKLGWFEAQSTPDNLSALRKRQRESRILPDTQLEKLVAVNILVESLVKEQLKAQEDSSQNFGYVDAAVQTDGSSRPPILMTSNAASGNSPSRATGSRRKRSRVTREPSVTPSLRDAFPLARPIQTLTSTSPLVQTPVVTAERPRKRPRRVYALSSSSSSEYEPSPSSCTTSPPSSAPATDPLSILDETPVIGIQDSDVDQQQDEQESDNEPLHEWQKRQADDQAGTSTAYYVHSHLQPAGAIIHGAALR